MIQHSIETIPNSLSITVHYKKGEEETVEKVQSGLNIIAEALGLGAIDKKTYMYGNGVGVAILTAGANQ